MTSKTEAISSAHDQSMVINYGRYPVAIVQGAGCELIDAEGRKYLDLFSGFGAGILGQCHPELVAAGSDQMNRLWHVGNLLHTEPQTQLAQAIAQHGFDGRSYFCQSGSDANEAAFKLARLYGETTGRYKILSTLASFHGRGFAAMMATGQDKVRRGFAPYVDGFSSVAYNDIAAMREAIDDQTVAIIVEPIQGEGGVHVPDSRYLTELRALCDERDLLLISDEVWTGCGRTGKWFGYQHAEGPITPDIMTLGKAVGCGLPVGVMCASQRIAELFDYRHYGGVPHATTLGGCPVTMAVSAKMFEIIERDQLVSRAAELGDQIQTEIRSWIDAIPAVRAVRGQGLFIGIELDPSADCWFDSASQVVERAMDAGLMVNACQANVLRLAPPLVIASAQIETGLTILKQVLRGERS